MFRAIVLKLVILAQLVFYLFCPNVILGVDVVTINKGNFDPVPIALNHPHTNSSAAANISEEVMHIIGNDLDHSGMFRLINPDHFIERAKGILHTPNFQSWQILNANILVNMTLDIHRNNIIAQVIIWDVATQKQVASKQLEGSAKSLRKLSHAVANLIYENIVGSPGYFNSKIAYVEPMHKQKKRVSRVAVMDYDGYNHRYVTDGKFLALTPRFSPDARKIAYVGYKDSVPRVYIHDLETGRENLVARFREMSFAPHFSPDGKSLLISVSEHGASNVFEINLYRTSAPKKLTNNQYINTSPTYSADMSSIYYNSDVTGRPNIYRISKLSPALKQLGATGDSYFTPIESPTGEYVACTKRQGGQFAIAVMRPDGTEERKLTEGFMVEGPSFSPNGRFIAFTSTNQPHAGSRGGFSSSYIYAVDITGNLIRKFNTPGFASGVDWSPNLD